MTGFLRRLAPAAVMLGLLAIGSRSEAGLQTFDLSWSGASFGNTAVATGTITMDPSVLDPNNYNDNSGFFFPQNVFVSALSITISGASSGNGTYTLGDFDTVALWPNGNLDYTRELVG